ncbi:unnamed protein product [Arabidopsis lyrata]|uniref:Protein kinase domain-containing protein n=1 Tax=Arabidopsis lyrata subsp. lyrata TaxID=81972 RepID=D7LE45_ARALL|nr:hypothetical protein ARALYDRAFT_343836 [Arabidopsis lyrata subsp. lyrata]CAH8263148.1 unnamed protein product [Arabidopsis lyrata]
MEEWHSGSSCREEKVIQLSSAAFRSIGYASSVMDIGNPLAEEDVGSRRVYIYRELVAKEIESLGRLSHKNLVKLRGWCKHKSELLLIYDYIPQGSLYSLLYSVPRQTGVVLSWDVRFQIAKGIASGLLYLHEEWEQIVVHRDVKPSNVLIDEDMNPS